MSTSNPSEKTIARVSCRLPTALVVCDRTSIVGSCHELAPDPQSALVARKPCVNNYRLRFWNTLAHKDLGQNCMASLQNSIQHSLLAQHVEPSHGHANLPGVWDPRPGHATRSPLWQPEKRRAWPRKVVLAENQKAVLLRLNAHGLRDGRGLEIAERA